MADTISIERKDGDGAYDEHYSGAWSGSPWTDVAANLTPGVTYKYRATRTIDGVTSGYSNEITVIYTSAYISIERKDGAGEYDHHYTGAWSGSPWVDSVGLSDGVTYKYRATRTLDGEVSSYSNEATVVYAVGSGGEVTIMTPRRGIW